MGKPIIILSTLCFANMDGSFLLRLCFKHWFNYISHILRYCVLIFIKYNKSDNDFFTFMDYLEVCCLISNISWFGRQSYFSGLNLLWPASIFYVVLIILSTLKSYVMCEYDLVAMFHTNLRICILMLMYVSSVSVITFIERSCLL